ncbi:MAG TPA: hypothetical protein VL651_06450 [Bacteroidia bacterium]|nr:hypothetical protein [Bacteroidia bacterium]
MKRKLPFLLLLVIPLLSFTKKKEPLFIRLKGYYIITSFNPKYPMCTCGLDISRTRDINNKIDTNAHCLCDGNYYKQIGYIHYASEKDLDPARIDDYKYQTAIEKYHHYTFLTTNPSILQDNYAGDPAIVANDSLSRVVKSDTVLAEKINDELSKAKMKFTTSRVAYEVLMKGEITAMRLNDVPVPKDYKTDILRAQYLLLNDPANTLKFVKILPDPWGK